MKITITASAHSVLAAHTEPNKIFVGSSKNPDGTFTFDVDADVAEALTRLKFDTGDEVEDWSNAVLAACRGVGGLS